MLTWSLGGEGRSTASAKAATCSPPGFVHGRKLSCGSMSEEKATEQSAGRAGERVKTKRHEFVIRNPGEHRRIDACLAARLPGSSRTFVKKLLEQQVITVNGEPVKPSYCVRDGDCIVALVPCLPGEKIQPEDLPLDVIYEDDWIVVVNKPPDMVVHPARGHQSGTLVNAIAYHCRDLSRRGGALRPGVVHRLDRDTSGVIMFVKSEQVHDALATQFEKRQVGKEYLAVCEGRIELDSDLIDAPIGRHPRQAEKMSVRETGKPAQTVYEVVERMGAFSVVRCFPRSGRTHQIRIHLQHIGHPVVADHLYGRRDALYLSDLTGEESCPSEEPLLDRQALHARRLTIFHPVFKREMSFETELADDMAHLLTKLRELYG